MKVSWSVITSCSLERTTGSFCTNYLLEGHTKAPPRELWRIMMLQQNSAIHRKAVGCIQNLLGMYKNLFTSIIIILFYEPKEIVASHYVTQCTNAHFPVKAKILALRETLGRTLKAKRGTNGGCTSNPPTKEQFQLVTVQPSLKPVGPLRFMRKWLWNV